MFRKEFLSAHVRFSRRTGAFLFGKGCADLQRLRTLQPAPAGDPADRPVRTFGYARVSTDDQNLALQLDALRKAGCDAVFEDRMFGKTTSRPALD